MWYRVILLVVLIPLCGKAIGQFQYRNIVYDFDGRADWIHQVIPYNENYLITGSITQGSIGNSFIGLMDVNGDLIWTTQLKVDGWKLVAVRTIVLGEERFLTLHQATHIGRNDRQFGVTLASQSGLIWFKDLGDTTINETCQDWILMPSGEIIINGSIWNGNDQNILTVKIDTSGNLISQLQIGSPTNNENSYTIVPMDDGGYMVGGYRTHLDHTSYPSQKFRWFIARIDSSGIPMWQRTLGGTQGKGYCLDLLPADDGTVYAFGFKQVKFHPQNEEWHAQIFKIDQQYGNYIYDSVYQYEINSDHLFRKGIFLQDSFIVVIGSIDSHFGKNKSWLLKIDRTGKILWSRKLYYSETHHNYLRDIVQTPDGGFLMVGSVLLSPNDAWVVKVDSMGCLEPGCHLGTGTGPQYTGPAVQLYPNPVQHTLTIAMPEGVHQASAIITNISGQMVYASTHISGNQTVSTIGWPVGIYLVQVATEAGLWHGKVVKVE